MSISEENQGAGAPASGSLSGSSGVETALAKVRRRLGGSKVPPSPPPPPGEEDEEDDGMLRMSFMEHLEELRSRILKAIAGVGVAAVLSLTFCNQLWTFVSRPAVQALQALHYEPTLVQVTPMESFNVIWFKLPILVAIFVSSPWILYQVWAFISPGLYRRERRWAAPFILSAAGLFIVGGVFAYFVVFRFGLTFLLSIGQGNYVRPMVSISEYFDLFVNVVLGVGLVFELPVLIFFLTLLRILSPAFLLKHSRYAILGIFIAAAIITPTPDVFNLMLFATPMCLLFYVGIFASYLLVLHREGKKFPWRKVTGIVTTVLLLLALVIYLAITRYGYKVVPNWPFLMR
jgi:sec-independent protein translocase protein TatC